MVAAMGNEATREKQCKAYKQKISNVVMLAELRKLTKKS